MPLGARPSAGGASMGRNVAQILPSAGTPPRPARLASGRLTGCPAATVWPAGESSKEEGATWATVELGTRSVMAARLQSVWYIVTPPHLRMAWVECCV